MSQTKKQDALSNRAEGDSQAIQHLKEAISGGKHWYLALLEAIGLWASVEEEYKGHQYRYLIDGEAFDWLLLAERLCEEVNGLIPKEEQANLLFHDRPPLELTKEEFKKLIGSAKYRAYLNYLYGILVEEALILAVVEEVRKERRSTGFNEDKDTIDKAYQRIYGDTQETLMEQFRKEKHYRWRKSISLSGLKEFTYWLFKYRLKRSDKTRVASDTKKALALLRRQWLLRPPQKRRFSG